VSLVIHDAKPTEFLPVIPIYQKDILAPKHLKSHLTVRTNGFLATENILHSRIAHWQNSKIGS